MRERDTAQCEIRAAHVDHTVVSFAVCRDCGVDIDSWRDRLAIHTATLVVTERGTLALQVEQDGVCDRCGGGRAEIRVETRPQLVAPPAKCSSAGLLRGGRHPVGDVLDDLPGSVRPVLRALSGPLLRRPRN